MDSWMRPDNLDYYYDLLRRGENGQKRCFQEAHQMAKSGFGTYCFNLAGRKYVLHMLVQLPILAQCSTANPKLIAVPALTKWITDLQRHKNTPEYRDAVAVSQPAPTDDHRRLSQV